MIDDPRAADSPPHRGRLVVGIVLAAALVAICWFLLGQRGRIEPAATGDAARSETGTGTRPATLFFGDPSGRRFVTEEREIAAGTSLESNVEAVITALVQGPHAGGGVRTLPPGAGLRRAFYDEESATVYLDFTPALVTQHPGGTTAEWNTLGSLLRTLGANFPEIVRIQILVDGQPIETLAGHFDTSQPLEITTWP